ncbi:MAG: peptidoglycan DD-metalloendopeptidase family protein [Gordonia sp. (in: high G+C Gram-positive bacteria)]|uniref:peptidoglycan DD-metalloendopeptidase family protein n=1 Tax=Gordonia sp. (in: high G+C Gram-positive bacteria) TaxID=84139 RepID=UPI0039E67EAB
MAAIYRPLASNVPVSSGFGPRGGQQHNGIDFACPVGTPIYAVADGVVVEGAEREQGSVSGFGSWIWIDCQSSARVDAVYGHVRHPGIRVRRGDRVVAGQLIGESGNEGQTTGPHLHFEVWGPPGRRGGRALDPAPWLLGALDPTEQEPEPGEGLTAESLSEAMGGSLSLARYRELLPGMANAMREAKIDTVLRAAHWHAQLGHESVGLRHMSEIWGPTPSQRGYEGRADLGNNRPGDGYRFRGSGPIQLTGRANFTRFSRWCFDQGYTKKANEIVDDPDRVRDDPKFGFLAASWYWTVARPQLNSLADADDLNGVTRAINGGLNGINDRRARLARCRRLGTRLLPGEEDELTPEERRLLREVHTQLLGPNSRGWPQLGQNPQGQNLTVVDAIAALRNDVNALNARIDELEKLEKQQRKA